MSRYIDADALERALMFSENIYELLDEDALYEVMCVIGSVPSIDIVRCKECKHWSGCGNAINYNHLCGRAREQGICYWTSADDFCSWGERSE